ncbi:N-acetyltransferase [Micromonospora sp. DT4]|uniref:N-acetyltransferase n=1 Tax=Micromonospora sp. DT4 TaxID=3393438 RepID=UPI003CEDF3F7
MVGLIADALHADPLGAWLVPDGRRRQQVLAGVAAIWVEHAMFFGDVHLADDHTAATVGFHRYRPIPPPTSYRIRLTDAAGSDTDRFDLLESQVALKQPSEPHYHLAFLVVAPTHQRTGRGNELLTHHCGRIDRVELPSWAVASAGAAGLLGRFGYMTRSAITLPDGPTLHPMRRNPLRRDDDWPMNAPSTSSVRHVRQDQHA